MANQRQQLTHGDLHLAVRSIEEKLWYRAEQKGFGTMASSHEILGIIEEEVHEFKIEVHGKTAQHLKIEELKDIAVAAIFGIASIKSGGVDW